MRGSEQTTSRSDPNEGVHLMGFTGFTCQHCSEHQEWDNRVAADSAAVWHLFDAHPLRWFAVAGGSYPVIPPPSRLGRQLVGA